MPNLIYNYVARGGLPLPPPGFATCPAGPIAGLTVLPNPIAPTWPQLYNAQTSIGVYPPGWALWENRWRLSSLRIASIAGVGPMAPSVLVNAMDATEKGQIGYHIGTATGLRLAQMTYAGAAGTFYFPLALTRAQNLGALFNFSTAQRPDFVIFNITLPVGPPALPTINNFIVWECKGHINNVGQAPLGPALRQSLALTNMVNFPGAGPLAAPMAPIAYAASQIDTLAPGYRLQATDPSKPVDDSEIISLDSMNVFLQKYYEPIAEMVSAKGYSKRYYDEQHFMTFEVLPKIRIGLDEHIYNILFYLKPKDMTYKISEILNQGFINKNPEKVWINKLGISMELESGWDDLNKQIQDDNSNRSKLY